MTSLIDRMDDSPFARQKAFLDLMGICTIFITCFGLAFMFNTKPVSIAAVLNILQTAYHSFLGGIIILSTPVLMVGTIIFKIIMLGKYPESTQHETYYKDTVLYLVIRDTCLVYISAFIAIILSGFG